MFVIEESPVPEVTLIRYDPALHPEFAGMLAELTPLKGTAERVAVAANVSAERVTAIVAGWNHLLHGKTRKSHYVVYDSYSRYVLAAHRPLGPGIALLATPEGFLEAIDVTKPHCYLIGGGHADAPLGVTLDSVVFESGRIAGRDTHDISNYLHGHRSAALWIAQRIVDAEASGEDIQEMLAAIRREEGGNRWIPRLAWIASRSPTHAKGWLDIPGLPRFFRSG